MNRLAMVATWLLLVGMIGPAGAAAGTPGGQEAPSDANRLIEQILANQEEPAAQARALMRLAEHTEKPADRIALLAKAVECGSADRHGQGGRGLAAEALDDLFATDAGNRLKWAEQRAELYHRWVPALRNPAERQRRTVEYIQALLDFGHAQAEAGDYRQACTTFRRAKAIAARADLPTQADLAERAYDRCRRRGLVDMQVERLAKRLEANPDDVDLRVQLVGMLVVDLDRPRQAVRYMHPALPEPWKTYLPLLAIDPADVEAPACREIGDWYAKTLTEGAEKDRQAALWARAAEWYACCAEAATDEETAGVVRLAAQAAAVKASQLTNAVSEQMAVFAAKRARLPIEQQMAATRMALAAANGGLNAEKFPVRFQAANGQIIGVRIRQVPGLASLEPLYGLPLERLSIESGRRGQGEQLRSFRGIHEMRLVELNLQGIGLADLKPLAGLQVRELNLGNCADLKSLAGIELMAVQHLKLGHCEKLTSLAPLKAVRLRSLRLYKLHALESLAGLENQALEALHLEKCTQVRDVSPLAESPLKALGVKKMPRLAGWEKLQFKGVRSLVLQSTHTPETLEFLAGNRVLTHLKLYSLGRLTSLKGIGQAPLNVLDLRECGKLQSLAAALQCPLAEVTVLACPKVPAQQIDAIASKPGVKLTR